MANEEKNYSEYINENESRKQIYREACNELKANNTDYKAFYMLYKFYCESNEQQAFLCLENAIYFLEKKIKKIGNTTNIEDEKNIEDLYDINRELSDMKKELDDLGNKLKKEGKPVQQVSIVILSYNGKEITENCIESIRKTVDMDKTEVVVVDNDSIDGSQEYLKKQKDIKVILSEENLGFPGGCNLGIKNSKMDNDIFLLNNDTQVAENSLFWLRMGLYENKKVGATGSMANSVSNEQQVGKENITPEEALEFSKGINVATERPYILKSKLIGFAMLIKRKAMDEIGMLDERFKPGNFEDDDYSLRLIEAGYRLLLCKNSYIYHIGSASFKKNQKSLSDVFIRNRKKFEDKWGFDSGNMSFVEKNYLKFFSKDRDAVFSICELGANLGNTLSYIKSEYPNARVYGVEENKNIAQIAQKYMDGIYLASFNKGIRLVSEENQFDYVVCSNVLEKVENVEEMLKSIYIKLKDTGRFIISVDNFMNYFIINKIIRGSVENEVRGALKKENRRGFSIYDAIKVIEDNQFRVINVYENKYQFCGRDEFEYNEIRETVNALSGIIPEPVLEQYDTQRYYIIAEKI